MKVIFLDIDGVLNNAIFLHENKNAIDNDELDSKSIGFLNEIIDHTGAKVVVSSSWRHGYTLKELRIILRKNGFNGSVIGVTPTDSKHKIRGEEIQAWLDSNKGIESFLILDDDSDMGNLLDRLVKTTNMFGLQNKHVDLAISMLNKCLD